MQLINVWLSWFMIAFHPKSTPLRQSIIRHGSDTRGTSSFYPGAAKAVDLHHDKAMAFDKTVTPMLSVVNDRIFNQLTFLYYLQRYIVEMLIC